MLSVFRSEGGRQTFQMLSRQRREIQSTAHSQLAKSGKERVDCIIVILTSSIFSYSNHQALYDRCWQ